MQIKDSLYHKVFQVEDMGKYKKVKLGDVRKGIDGEKEYCYWLGSIVGKAKEIEVKAEDTINIRSGQIFTTKGKDGNFYTRVTIFAFEVVPQDGQKKEKVDLKGTPFEEVELEDADFDLPF